MFFLNKFRMSFKLRRKHSFYKNHFENETNSNDVSHSMLIYPSTKTKRVQTLITGSMKRILNKNPTIISYFLTRRITVTQQMPRMLPIHNYLGPIPVLLADCLRELRNSFQDPPRHPPFL